MTWLTHHRRSEALVVRAELSAREGHSDQASSIYADAARAEEKAAQAVGLDKLRTLGIISVSAAALWLRSGLHAEAERTAHRFLQNPSLPHFAYDQLKTILQTAWLERSKKEAGVQFIPGEIYVAVKGGEVIFGAAPLDLILDKIQTVRALFYRVIEFVQGGPFRTDRTPPRELQEACRPWLLQAPASSYQFAVAVQAPRQADFFKADVDPQIVAREFLKIVAASVGNDPKILAAQVPNEQYRRTFLQLVRNLTPTGRAYSRLEIRSPESGSPIALVPEQRDSINSSLRPTIKNKRQTGKEILAKGVLRALHLDDDWLSVTTEADSLHIVGVRETVDDVIGPMVNRRVLVRYYDTGRRKQFADIELDE
jgi:hypothetical protein